MKKFGNACGNKHPTFFVYELLLQCGRYGSSSCRRLTDWLKNQLCSPFVKRNQLDCGGGATPRPCWLDKANSLFSCVSWRRLVYPTNMSTVEKGGGGGSVAKDSKTTTDRAELGENLSEIDAVFRSTFSLDPAEEYKMDNKRRGLALIFNQEYFFWRLGMNVRHGTNTDRSNLERRFKEINFDVHTYDNLRQEEVLNTIREAAEANHADADCFVCIFLSHGENDYVYAHDGKISIQDITALFKGDKCRSLVGKPKIFILQACRGDKHDEPVTAMDVVDSEAKTNEVVVDAGVVYTLPAGADFIMCYSVAEGYYSHRETINGSWYIQDLCEVLQKFGDSLEFTELLTLVNRKVSLRSVGNSNDRSAIGKKQVPCFASMLTKKLYFRPKK